MGCTAACGQLKHSIPRECTTAYRRLKRSLLWGCTAAYGRLKRSIPWECATAFGQFKHSTTGECGTASRRFRCSSRSRAADRNGKHGNGWNYLHKFCPVSGQHPIAHSQSANLRRMDAGSASVRSSKLRIWTSCFDNVWTNVARIGTVPDFGHAWCAEPYFPSSAPSAAASVSVPTSASSVPAFVASVAASHPHFPPWWNDNAHSCDTERLHHTNALLSRNR